MRATPVWRFVGLFMLICATAFYIWGRRGIVMASVPADKVVAVTEFSDADFTGPLDEVLIDGYFRQDQAVKVRFPRSVRISVQEILLIPVTSTD